MFIKRSLSNVGSVWDEGEEGEQTHVQLPEKIDVHTTVLEAELVIS